MPTRAPSSIRRQRAKLNALLRDIDQLLLDDRGLPGRPWYKNLIYAPGPLHRLWRQDLPGVREAIEERRFDDANVYAGPHRESDQRLRFAARRRADHGGGEIIGRRRHSGGARHAQRNLDFGTISAVSERTGQERLFRPEPLL